jgi:hypothetical protein
MAGRPRLAGVMSRAIPHGFNVSDTGAGRIIIVASSGGFDQFVAAAGEPAPDLRLPQPAFTRLAAAHGIQILPPARTLTTQARLPRGCPHQVLCEASQPPQHSQLLSRGRMTRPIMWVSCGPTCVVISVAAGKSAFSPQHAKWRQCRGPVWQTDRHLFQRRPR